MFEEVYLELGAFLPLRKPLIEIAHPMLATLLEDEVSLSIYDKNVKVHGR